MRADISYALRGSDLALRISCRCVYSGLLTRANSLDLIKVSESLSTIKLASSLHLEIWRESVLGETTGTGVGF